MPVTDVEILAINPDVLEEDSQGGIKLSVRQGFGLTGAILLIVAVFGLYMLSKLIFKDFCFIQYSYF